MSKELVISANRHETRVALIEDDQLVEVYFQRANEYSLAGSIHKGRVTRVLPGMQSAFVDLGLERDTFLYVSDFLEEHEDIDRVTGDERPPRDRERRRPRPRPCGRDRRSESGVRRRRSRARAEPAPESAAAARREAAAVRRASPAVRPAGETGPASAATTAEIAADAAPAGAAIAAVDSRIRSTRPRVARRGRAARRRPSRSPELTRLGATVEPAPRDAPD